MKNWDVGKNCCQQLTHRTAGKASGWALSSQSRGAFTLIELLVVIAIITLLAAILFPVFERAQANANKSSCQSNLKQLALGMVMYVGDYDSTYPLFRQEWNTGLPTGSWAT